MAKDNNLTDFLTDLANTIREKTNTSDAINPQDFASIIESLQGDAYRQDIITNKLNGFTFGDDNTFYAQETVLHTYDTISSNNVLLFIGTKGSLAKYLSPESFISCANNTIRITNNNDITIVADGDVAGNLQRLSGYVVIWAGDFAYDVDFFYMKFREALCFCNNTEISLFDGQSKKIQDIDYNDELLVWNFDKGKFDKSKPLWIKKAEKTNSYYKVTLENDSTINLVGSNGRCHRLFNYDDMVFESATELVGKRVHTLNGLHKIKSVDIVDENCSYYNIITEYHMNFFANGILTSCRYNNIYPITKMMFVKPTSDKNQSSEDMQKRIMLNQSIPHKYIRGMRLDECRTESIEDTITYIRRLERLKKNIEDFEENDSITTRISDIEVGWMNKDGKVYGFRKHIRGQNAHEVIAKNICKSLDIENSSDKSFTQLLVEQGWILIGVDYFANLGDFDLTELQFSKLMSLISERIRVKNVGLFRLGGYNSNKEKADDIQSMNKKTLTKKMRGC